MQINKIYNISNDKTLYTGTVQKAIDECIVNGGGIRENIKNGAKVILENVTKGEKYELAYDYSDRQTAMILDGGLLNYTKNIGK